MMAAAERPDWVNRVYCEDALAGLALLPLQGGADAPPGLVPRAIPPHSSCGSWRLLRPTTEQQCESFATAARVPFRVTHRAEGFGGCVLFGGSVSARISAAAEEGQQGPRGPVPRRGGDPSYSLAACWRESYGGVMLSDCIVYRIM